MIKNLLSALIAICLLVLVIRSTISDMIFLINRKEAKGTVVTYTVPQKDKPTTYLFEVKFFDEYVHDSVVRKLDYLNREPALPQTVNIYYSVSTKRIFASNKEHITWVTVVWTTIVDLLIIFYLIITTKEMVTKRGAN